MVLPDLVRWRGELCSRCQLLGRWCHWRPTWAIWLLYFRNFQWLREQRLYYLCILVFDGVECLLLPRPPVWNGDSSIYQFLHGLLPHPTFRTFHVCAIWLVRRRAKRPVFCFQLVVRVRHLVEWRHQIHQHNDDAQLAPPLCRPLLQPHHCNYNVFHHLSVKAKV